MRSARPDRRCPFVGGGGGGQRPGRFRRFFVPLRTRLFAIALASVRVVRGVEEGAEKTEALTDGVVAGAEVTIGSARVSRRRHLDPRWSRRSPLRLFLGRCVARCRHHPPRAESPALVGRTGTPSGRSSPRVPRPTWTLVVLVAPARPRVACFCCCCYRAREGAAGADVPISFAPCGRRRSTLIDEKTDRVQMECSGVVFKRITVSITLIWVLSGHP